jgi:hypothetical protein
VCVLRCPGKEYWVGLAPQDMFNKDVVSIT